MKLYLSSMDIPNTSALVGLIEKPLSHCRMALITNAKDYYNERLRAYKIREGIARLSVHGFAIDEIDLRNFHNRSDELKNELSSYDIIWAYGGNTHCLRDEMHQSGFDTIIRDLLEKGIVYGGESAGALVAGTSIKGFQHYDIPEAAEHIMWDGLKLIDKYIVPHANNTFYSDAITEVITSNKDNSNFIALDDNQALVVNGDSQKITS